MTDPEETKSVEKQPEETEEEKPPPPEEPETVPPPAEEVEKPPPAERVKRKYTKRKVKVLQDEVKKQNETREEDEPPPKKRVRVTKEEDTPTPPAEQPSFMRGAIVKPLLLGLLASGSFLVNHMFNTNVPAPLPPQQKKNTTQTNKTGNLRNTFDSVVLPHQKKNTVPGFD